MSIEGRNERYPELVRYAYLESLLQGRRVLLLSPGGDAGGADDVLVEKGAAEAVVADPSPPGTEDLTDGSFDLVLVPDLGACVLPDAVLAEARRVLAPQGFAVVAIANRDAGTGFANEPPPDLGYYELYDLCASLWPRVKMFGQSPFVGYALAEFAMEGEDEGISFDASLVGGGSEEVEFFVAICGEEAPEVDPFSVVQIPLESVAPREVDGTVEAASELQSALEEARASLEELREEVGERGIRAQRLEHELQAMEEEARKARDRAARFAKELDDEKRARQRAELEGQLARRAPDLQEARTRIEELEAELAKASEAALEAGADRDRMAEALESAHAEIADRSAAAAQLETRLEEAAEAARAATGAEELTKGAAELDARLAELQAALDSSDAERGEEVRRLEEILATRAEELELARAALERQSAIATDLLAELETAAPRGGGEAEAVAALESSLVTLEADLVASRSALTAERDQALARLSSLQDRLVELEGEVQAARWDASLHESRVSEAIQAAEVTREHVGNLERLLAEQRDHATELDRLLARAREESREAELRATDAEWRRTQAEAWLADLRTRAASSSGQARGAMMRILELEGELDETKRRRESLEEEIEADQGRIAGLEASVRELRVSLEEATARLEAEKGERERSRTSAERIEREVVERREAMDRLLAGLQGEARGYRMRAQELAAERNEERARREAAELARADAEKQLEEALAGEATLRDRAASHEHEAVREHGEIRGLRFALAEARRATSDLEGAAWEASAEIGRLKGVMRRERLENEDRLDAARRELEDSREALASLRSEGEAARSELDRLVARASELETELERLREAHRRSEDDSSRAREELEVQSGLLGEREAALERLAAEIAEAGARLAEKDREHERLRAALAEAQEVRQAAETSARDSGTELERLRGEGAKREERVQDLERQVGSTEDRAVAVEGKLAAVREVLLRLVEEPAASPVLDDLRALLKLLADG